MNAVSVIGGGLAGCEAAYQLAKRGLPVTLYEMRPQKMTPAHTTANLAELVCSNSLRASSVENAVGLLKEEMRRLDSLIIRAADATRVPAGAALACDREAFSLFIEEALTAQPLVQLIRQEVTVIPDGIVIIAAGPLASEGLMEQIGKLVGSKALFFHDAIAPLVFAESIDMSKAFFASRYDKGEGADYLNCAMDRCQYLRFYEELLTAQLHPLHDFENEKVFEGCMPIEAMAKRGLDTMRFGPLKPVGLKRPDGTEPYAVVQLRSDNATASLYNMVGFQTRLTHGEQKRVFTLIPGLEQAEFARLGTMHRNSYINSPQLLQADLSLKTRPELFFAGQITGVEGYVESAAAGLAAGINAAEAAKRRQPLIFPEQTALGSLLRYISIPGGAFQPMNVNFGLFPPIKIEKNQRKQKNLLLAQRALQELQGFIEKNRQAFE